ncbi:MAG: right-handed parallel beta-helix repeat-containing protein [Bacteroidales bacterium]|nr:right-handed parallel beta-helix repeat-containing protein [Bacteroidales bacterium]
MLRKSLLFITLMAFLAPSVSIGQTAVNVDANHPFNDGFEGDTCTWTFLNGGSVNAWYWGEATNNGGSHSVYISNNGGVNNSYNTSGAATWVYFTKDFSFESGAYRFSYNWKCAGEGGYDYIRVGLLPSTTAPTPGNGLPSDWISLDNNANLNGSSNWTSRSVDLDITEAGDYKLAFAWRNDGSGGSNPPGAIDNVRITKMVVEPYTYFTQTSDNDFVKGSGLNVVVAEGSVHLEQQMTSVADWNATANLPQSLKGHQMVTWRNYVYLVGGHNGSGNVSKVYRATQQDDGISGWTELNALPVSLSDMAVVATQTHLIVMGGHNASGIVDKIHVAKFNDDGSIGTWQESEQMLPEPRWGLRAAIALDDIYIIGGATDDTLNIATNTVYRASLNTLGLIDTIVAVGSLPAARNGHALAVYDSKLIVTGGYDASQTAQATVYSAEVNLDGTLGSWQSKQALTEATYNHSMLCANGVLAILGGHDGNIPSNKFYYTTLDDTDFSWTLSDVMLSERYAQGAAFAFGNKFFFAGGAATSGVVNSLVSYMAVTTSDEPVMKSAFIGIPYYIGTPKTLQDLSYTLTNPSAQAYEILYRTADEGMNYGNWTSAGSNLPAVVNQSKSYIQYMFRISATGTNDFAIDDVTLTVAGYTQLEGNLNWIGDLTAANSPYLVTSDISFTSGTHNIEPGVTIMFMPNTGLNIGQASVNFNGTQANTILLTAYESGNGSWNGVYFQDASDNGVSSLMEYTTIEKAGSGDNDANLYLYYTNQPTINHCTFQMAVGQGAKFQNSSPTISNSNFTQNTGRGLYLLSSSPTCTACTLSDNYGGVWLDNSAPTFNNTAITGNTYDGIRYQTANFDATFYGVTSSGNKYGMYSCTPNRSFTFDSNEVAFADNTADIAVAGGQISSDQTWNNYANGYALLGNVEIYGGTPKLTLRPGVTLKVQTGYSLYVGRNSNQGGMLYAVGTTSAPITFTSLNDEVGGWTGLRFRDGSDYSSTSSLRHCVVEKATANLVCESTNQPSVMWCTFQDAQNEDVYLNNASISIEGSTIKNATKGLWVNSSAPTLVSVVFENMSECCVYHNNECTVTYSDCTMKDSNFGIRYWTCNKDMVNDDNISFQNNFCNIAVPGGHINETRTWDGNTYAILNDLRVGRYRYDTPNHNRLTIMPGAILKFAEGKRMDVGGYWSGTYWGELYAEGIAEQPITFTSLNGEVGGWNGLVFNGESDDFAGASSSLKHCVIEKGNERNLHLGSTNQPGLIEDCIFRQSVSQCVYMENSRDTIRNCHFEDNQSHSLYYNNGHYVGVLENLTFSGNLYDGVTVNGGHVSEDRVWNAQAYFILNDLRVGRYRYDTPNHNRLTIMPGAILKFAEGKRMDVGGYWSGTYWGELYAEGTAEQPVTFTSMNGEVGGWNGLVFNGESDDFAGAYSLLKHTVFEKGNEYNLYIQGTTLPEIENSIFQKSNGYGVRIGNEYNRTIKNSVFKNNASHGIYIVQTTPFTLGGSPENANSIYNNGGYAVYQDGGSDIDMTYNFWGEIGSKAIDDNLIYDKKDNSSKGRITFEPVSWFPVENLDHLQGTFAYNDTKPMGNREMNIVSENDSIMATATTDGNGSFDFSNYAVSVYNILDDDFGVDVLAGVNATDALLAMRHFVHLDTLTDARLAVADVNQSGSVNGTDAMLIMRRAVDGTFPAGDFYYYTPAGISFSGDTCLYDLSFLCFGDVNGSYTPQSREQTMTLVQEGSMVAESYQELEIPIILKTAVEMGALTLRIDYPAEYLEIENVVLTSSGESLLFTAIDGELRTAWYDLNPLNLNENDGLVTIKVRANDLSLLDEPVFFTLSPYSELADGSAQVIEDVVIAMPEIVTETLGFGNLATNDGVSLSVYPNPANDVCRLSYELSEAGRVTVSVYNMMGVKVMDVANIRQEEGRHELQMATSRMAAGMYRCRVTFEGESSWVKSTVIIIEK